MRTITCLLTQFGLGALIIVGTSFGDGAVVATSPESLVFTAPVGGANPADQVLRISNGVPGALEWTIEEDCAWLSVSRTSGTAESGYTSLVVVSVDVAGLAQGGYNCQMLVHGTGAANSPKVVPVSLSVQGAVLEVSPTQLSFSAAEGASDPADQILVIRNTGVAGGNWTIECDPACGWLSAAPLSGSLAAGAGSQVAVSVAVAGLAQGDYTCRLTVRDALTSAVVQEVTVILKLMSGEGLWVPYDFPTIQAAIDAAVAGGEVVVADGTYTGDGNRDIDLKGKAITLRSANGPENCIIDCQNVAGHRGFYLHTGEGASSIIRGFTITRGYTSAHPAKGGAILCEGAAPTIEDCILIGNKAQPPRDSGHFDGSAAYGGALYCTATGMLTVKRCRLTDNTAAGAVGYFFDQGAGHYMTGKGGAAFGGAIYVGPGTEALIEACEVRSNRAVGADGDGGMPDEFAVYVNGAGGGEGGGLYAANGSSVQIHNSVFADNRALGGAPGMADGGYLGAGGVFVGGGLRVAAASLSDCVVAGNVGSAGDSSAGPCGGAGINHAQGDLSLANCLLAANEITSMSWSWGVALESAGNVSLRNCTVAHNPTPVLYPPDPPSAVWVGGGGTITDCIMWSNNGNDVGGLYVSVRYSCTEQTIAGEGNIHVDPLFVTGPDGDYSLSQMSTGQAVNSPCVDAGSSPAADLDLGSTRTDGVPDEGVVDMGYHYPAEPETGPQVLTVNTDGTGDYATIQAAIDAAADGAEVIVADGTYTGDGNRDIDLKGKAITLRSANGPANCIVDCQATGPNPHRAFYVHSGEGSGSVVRGFTITGGKIVRAPARGGGIYCVASSPVFEDCIIKGNYAGGDNSQAALGGGVYCGGGGSPQFIRCVIRLNTAVGSSGDFDAVYDEVTRNCTAAYGGGVACESANASFVDCTISNNTARGGRGFSHSVHHGDGAAGHGGGLYSKGGTVVLQRCLITDNIAGGGPGGDTSIGDIQGPSYGGGISGDAGVLVKNSIIARNTAEYWESYRTNTSQGDGTYKVGTIQNCTIVYNTHGTNGYGNFEGNLVENSIIWGNNAYIAGSSGHPVYSYCDIENRYAGIQGTGNLEVDPGFVNSAEGDYHLLGGSPCVNRGNPAYSPDPGETDIDGESRILQGRIEIGADETDMAAGPLLDVWPADFLFRIDADDPAPGPQILSIRNSWGGVLDWEVVEDCAWLDVEPATGQSTGEIDKVAISVNGAGLGVGVYTCQLTVRAPGAMQSPKTVSVELNCGYVLRVPEQYSSIQAAIDAAAPGDKVIVSDGIHTGSGNRDINLRGKSITVRSQNGPEHCIIDCGGIADHRGFVFESGETRNCVVRGFTITGGRVTEKNASGGAVYCYGSSPTIDNCVLRGNTAVATTTGGARGGAVYSRLGSPKLTGCDIIDNSALGRNPSGGGVYCGLDANLLIMENCLVMGNRAETTSGVAEGGGITGGLTIRDSVIQGNVAKSIGDGVGLGGGLCIQFATVSNCLILDNNVAERGGGDAIYFPLCMTSGPIVVVQHCTIVGNFAEAAPGDCCRGAMEGDCSDGVVTHCILWNNGARDFAEGPGFRTSYNCSQTQLSGQGNISSDPLFASGPGGDYYLSQGAAGQGVTSPCVDAGSSPAAGLGLGTTRSDGAADSGIVDMGYHYPLLPNVADLTGDGAVDMGDWGRFAQAWRGRVDGRIPQGEVTVDGLVGEWGEPEWTALDTVYDGQPSDVDEARFALRWSPQTNRIYAVVMVHDTTPWFTPTYTAWNAGDRIEVYCQGDAAGGTGWGGAYDAAQQYMVGADGGGGAWAAWGEGGAIGQDAGFEYAVNVSGDTVIYEVGAKAFDHYGGLSGEETVATALNAGAVVGFDLTAATRWAASGFGMLAANDMKGKYLNAAKFARWLLVDAAAPCAPQPADLDGNCVLNFADVLIFADNWLDM